ncbi:MAG: helix-turn-helix domain-containing protein [Arenicella sp.]
MKHEALCDSVRTAMQQYFQDMQGEAPNNLYQLFMSQVEKPFIEVVLKNCNNNQSKAAEILGINRNTLRKKIQIYKIKS